MQHQFAFLLFICAVRKVEFPSAKKEQQLSRIIWNHDALMGMRNALYKQVDAYNEV